MKADDDRLPFSHDVLPPIDKSAIPRILPQNQKPDMLLDKARKKNEATVMAGKPLKKKKVTAQHYQDQCFFFIV